MDTRSDVRFTWFGRLPVVRPMVDPGLGIDEFENSHPCRMRDRLLAREHVLNGTRIDDTVRSKPAA